MSFLKDINLIPPRSINQRIRRLCMSPIASAGASEGLHNVCKCCQLSAVSSGVESDGERRGGVGAPILILDRSKIQNFPFLWTVISAGAAWTRGNEKYRIGSVRTGTRYYCTVQVHVPSHPPRAAKCTVICTTCTDEYSLLYNLFFIFRDYLCTHAVCVAKRMCRFDDVD